MVQADFYEMHNLVSNAFNQSAIGRSGKQWSYDICATPIIPHNVLIVGFNWGVGQGDSFLPPQEPPTESFLALHEKRLLGSMSRTIPFLRNYLSEPELESIGQGNYCFFRSQRDNQISEKDLDLCSPIFDRFLEIALPSKVLSFSGRLWKYLLASGRVKHVTNGPSMMFSRGKREFSYSAAKATLTVGAEDISVYKLPHPNYPMQSQYRTRAWEFCFDSIMRD